jgi:putative transposase
VVIEPKNKEILATDISKNRNISIVKRFLSHIVNKMDYMLFHQTVVALYHQACRFLKLVHHLHFSFEKSKIERTMQYIKDRIECVDDLFPCRKKKCKLKHVIIWLNLFVDYHNKELCLKCTEPEFRLYMNISWI